MVASLWPGLRFAAGHVLLSYPARTSQPWVEQKPLMAHFLRILCYRVWLGLRALEDPGGLAEMPEAAKVAFVEMSLAFVAVSIFLLVTSVSITVLLFFSVPPPLVGRWARSWRGVTSD